MDSGAKESNTEKVNFQDEGQVLFQKRAIQED